MTMNIQELIMKAKEVTASGLPFMEGKEKLEVKGAMINSTLTVDDFGYLEGDEGQYVVIALREYPQNFIYGSSVVTESFKKLESVYTKEQMEMIIAHGLTFRLSELISKNKRKYTKVTFFPEN